MDGAAWVCAGLRADPGNGDSTSVPTLPSRSEPWTTVPIG
jgi:hypothetical protein